MLIMAYSKRRQHEAIVHNRFSKLSQAKSSKTKMRQGRFLT